MLVSSDGGATWQRLHQRAQLDWLRRHRLARRRTLDGGRSGWLAAVTASGGWRTVHVDGTETLAGVAFAGKEGWAVGDDGLLMHSGNDGQTWTRLHTLPATADFASVAALGDGRAWAAGSNGLLLSTTDGGATWQGGDVVPTDLHCVTFLDATHG